MTEDDTASRPGRPAAATPGAPYARLGPDAVLDALDAVGLRGDGRLIQLNSYENRVFQVFLEDGRVVVAKFYRPGRWTDAQIVEEHVFAGELAADEVPIAAPWPLQVDPASLRASMAHPVAPTLAVVTLPAEDGAAPTFRYTVAARQAGRAPELGDPAVLEWIGRFLGRLHTVGARQRFAHRLALDVDTYGRASRDGLLAAGHVAEEARPRWQQLVDAALERCDAAFAATGAASIRLHGDCHWGNVLWTEAGPHFVDLDDAVQGPAVQDLWMLLSGDRHAMQRQLGHVLDGYEAFAEFDRRELALVEPLRTLRMLHHSAWIARRWHDPAFPAAFPFFASPAYWQQECVRLGEQLEAMDETPLVA